MSWAPPQAGAGELDISAGSTLTDPGLVVGGGGRGSVTINSGSTVVTNPGTAAAVIANQSGSGGSSVNVVGAGSDWQVNGALVVGNGDAGALDITAGGTVSAATIDLAHASQQRGRPVGQRRQLQPGGNRLAGRG